MRGLPTDEIAKRLFGYTESVEGKTRYTTSILGNYFANIHAHDAAIDELIETGKSSVPIIMTETARSAEGHLFLQGLAELIDRVQNGESLDPALHQHLCEHLETVATDPDYGMEGFGKSYYDEFRRYADVFDRWLQGRNGNPPVAVAREVVCPDGREYTFYDWNTEYNEQNQLVGHPSVADFFAYNNNYARGAFMPKGAGNVLGDPLGGLHVQAAMARHLLGCPQGENAEQGVAEDLSLAVENTALDLMSLLDELEHEASLPEEKQRYTRLMLFRPAMPHVLSRLANLTAALKFAEQNNLKLSEGASQKINMLLNNYGLKDPNSHVYRTLDAMFTLSAGASPMMFQKGYTVAEQAFGGPDEPHVVYAPDSSVKTLDDHLLVWSNFLQSNSQQRGS
jgi:hypothetical protein